MGWTTSTVTFEQMKSLIETDFFSIEQIKVIKYGLQHNETFPFAQLNLTDEQIKVLRNLEVVKP